MQRKVIGPVVAIAVQGVFLIGILLSAAWPLWFGETVRVATEPVDPRSMFRGNYAELSYAFNRVPEDLFGADKVRRGQVVYVSLTRGDDGLYAMSGASLDKPASGVFLRGRAHYKRYVHREVKPLDERHPDLFRSNYEWVVNYGLDAFFAPKVEALRLERELRNTAVATLRVLPNGRARLQSIDASR